MRGRADRFEARVDARLAARQLDDPDVRGLLDELEEAQLWRTLGEPRRVTRYAESFGYWHVGDPRPALADDDPAVMQAIGRCAVARLRAVGGLVLGSAIHPEVCGWCGFPLVELLAACDRAIAESRYVLVDLHVWDGVEGSAYIRDIGRSGTYEAPAWAAFWTLPSGERARRVEAAITASRAGLAA